MSRILRSLVGLAVVATAACTSTPTGAGHHSYGTPVKLPFEGTPGFDGKVVGFVRLAVDLSGDVYVLDGDHDQPPGTAGGSQTKVLELTKGSDRPTSFAIPDLDFPSSVNSLAVDSAGNLYVADGGDTGHKRVVKIDAGSHALTELPFAFGVLDYPRAVTVDQGGNVFAISSDDGGNFTILKLAPGAAAPSVFSTFPYSTGSSPVSTVDKQGNVYVTSVRASGDKSPNEIIKFSSSGTKEKELPLKSTSPNGTSYNLSGVAVDGHGNVFVSDAGSGVVSELSAGSGEQSELAIPLLNSPKSIALDMDGNIYLLDKSGGSSEFGGGALKFPVKR